MDDQLKSNLTSGEHWTRLIYMLLSSVFLYIASLLGGVLVVAQFVFAIVTGAPNERLRALGWEISTYIHQVWQFLSYNSEDKAFPFSDWPQAPIAVVAVDEVSEDSSEDSIAEEEVPVAAPEAEATVVASEPELTEVVECEKDDEQARTPEKQGA